MELILGGIFVIFSGFLANISEKGNVEKSDEVENSNEPMERQYRFMVFFGCLLVLMGVGGIASGAYSYAIAVRERLLITLLLFWMNIQLRIIVFNQNDVANQLADKGKKSNLLEIVSKAISVGVFPSGSAGYVFAINFTQIAICMLIISIVLS